MLGRQSDPPWPFVLSFWGLALTISPRSQCRRMERRRPVFLRLQYPSRVWGALSSPPKLAHPESKQGARRRKGEREGKQGKRGEKQVNNRGNPWDRWWREKRRKEGEKERMRNRKIPEQQSACRIKATLKIRLAQICFWSCRWVHSKLWRGCQLTTTDMHRCLRY